ncbi:MAG: DNA mismatch repair protein MutS [Planctomycetes bacterium]|nr:DNA mismatch repair protein MutS [Planctomycetota bacterium]
MSAEPEVELPPVMRQYWDVKKQHPGELVFFRLGDFYEMFDEDAKTASRVLGLTLTSRFKGDKAVAMAGVPVHAVNTYLARLLRAGFRVAVCEQVEEADDSKKLVEREVVRVITPGTLTEEGLLESNRPNYLAALFPGKDAVGLAWLDLSTGTFRAEDVTRRELLDELARLDAAEGLVPESQSDSELARECRGLFRSLLTPRPDWSFERQGALRVLNEHFGTRTLAGFGCGDLGPALSAAGAVLAYVQETQKAPLTHILRLERFRRAGHLLMDRSSQASLELVQTLRGGELRGSLLWVLDRTRTPMGGRMLREWVASPLVDAAEIAARHDAVAELAADGGPREGLEEVLRRMPDVERIAATLGSGRANARHLGGLRQALSLLPEVVQALRPARSPLLAAARTVLEAASAAAKAPKDEVEAESLPAPIEAATPESAKEDDAGEEDAGPAVPTGPIRAYAPASLAELRALLERALADDPPLAIKEGGLLRDGFDEELDRTRAPARDWEAWIKDYREREVKRTGIPSLKVAFNQVFGFYIEVTNAHEKKIPPDYRRKQTLKNAERYITPELKDYETRFLRSEATAKDLEYRLFLALREAAARHLPACLHVAGAVAAVDSLASLARVARENRYVRPRIVAERVLRITDGRHPVLEKVLDDAFVPNDVYLDETEQRLLVLTGPNMAGKSTYIRQVALLCVMAQMGGFVPASEATIGLVDRIFTRVGAADEIARGASTFMVEMTEAANILNNATNRSLIVLDELGRGTSTFDGVSLAWAIAEHLHDRVGARTLFATHYHELTELALVLPGVRNYHVAVKEWGDGIVFLRKILEGPTDKSYGLHVARLAGLPREVLSRAKVLLKNLEAQTLDADNKPKFAPRASRPRPGDAFQLGLFAPPPNPAVAALAALDVEALTPLAALVKLQELKAMAEKGR